MKVRDLIKQLQKMDGDLRVIIRAHEGYYDYVEDLVTGEVIVDGGGDTHAFEGKHGFSEFGIRTGVLIS